MKLESLAISRDAALLEVLQPTLEKISVQVEACGDSRAGFLLLGKRKFDAVIVDCDDLQGGKDLLAKMRTASSNAKSVAFAVLNGKTTTQEAFQMGANFVLQKPVTTLHASRCFNAALNFMVRERRRYFRYPVEISVHLNAGKGSDFKVTSTNVSEGGMAIRTLAKLPKETPVSLRFTLPQTNVTLELKGQVAWVDGSRQAGVRFVEVPQSSQYQLDKWLTERLQGELPHHLLAHTT
jgi:uncharacterized protein (TIGR02266 family)